MDTSLIRTLHSVLSVSVLERFDCIFTHANIVNAQTWVLSPLKNPVEPPNKQSNALGETVQRASAKFELRYDSVKTQFSFLFFLCSIWRLNALKRILEQIIQKNAFEKKKNKELGLKYTMGLTRVSDNWPSKNSALVITCKIQFDQITTKKRSKIDQDCSYKFIL